MKRLIMHVGCGKAASTYVQSVMIQNEAALTENKVAYIPKFQTELMTKAPRAVLRPYMELACAHEAETIVLSNENLFNPITPSADGFYSGAQRASSVIKEMADDYSDKLSLEFLYICRNPLEFQISAFIQKKKQGVDITLETWLEQMNEQAFAMGNIHQGLTILKETGPVTVLSYDMIKSDLEGFVRRYFGPMGLTPEMLDFTPGVVNPSINEDGIRILEIAARAIDKDKFKVLRKNVQAFFPKTEPFSWETALKEKYGALAKQNQEEFLANWP